MSMEICGENFVIFLILADTSLSFILSASSITRCISFFVYFALIDHNFYQQSLYQETFVSNCDMNSLSAILVTVVYEILILYSLLYSLWNKAGLLVLETPPQNWLLYTSILL